jgi:triacylglycerol lipase
MRRVFLILILLFGSNLTLPAREHVTKFYPEKGDYVVVVHGWAWLRDTMRATVSYLHENEYAVVNLNYDARKEFPEEIANTRIAEAVKAYCRDGTRKVHFVGHSMGCLMIRQYLKSHHPENLGEVVFLAAPNQGIEYVDRFNDQLWFRKIFGNSARLLGVGEGNLPDQLGPAVGYAPGIIMGHQVRLPLLSRWLEGPDDGVVSVASGKMEGMREMIQVRCVHMNLPQNKPALRQTVHFLRKGRFSSTER